MARELQIEIGKIITEYTKEVADIVEKLADEIAKETVEELKNTSPKKSGKYARGWKVKKENKTRIIHNSGHGQLTHLLEFGHATVNGGRTRAFPHIAPAEKNAKKNFEDKVRREIESIG